MWRETTFMRFMLRVLMLPFLVVICISTPPEADAQMNQSEWSVIGNTPGGGGIAESVLGFENFYLIVRQTATQARADTWLYQLNANSPNQLQSVGSILTPPIRFEQGVSLAWDGTRFIYVLVGANYNTRNRTGFLRYDTCLHQSQSCAVSWEFLEATPSEQGPGNAIAYARAGNREYVYAFLGASTAERSNATTSFARYDISARRWETLNRPPLWDCTDDGVALEWDRAGFIYALNGSDCNDLATTRVSRYLVSPTAGSWQAVTSIPRAVDSGGSLLYDNNEGLIALAGAGVSLPSGTGEDVYRLDFNSLQWEELSDLPCPVGGFSGERLGVANGEIIAWQGNKLFAPCGGTAIMRYSP